MWEGVDSMTDKEYKQMSIREFSKAAKVYETDQGGVYKMCKKDYPDVLEELEKEDFTDLLDCGCGPAPMLTLLHRKYPQKHYTGIDLTPEMIEVARAKNMEGVELPLVNLTGHGDVHVYGTEEVRQLCETAGLIMETGEKRGFFRLHCVARKPESPVLKESR